MSADLVWPLAVVGTVAVWVGITVAAEWLRKRRARRAPAWWERDHRDRQTDREVEESKPHIWNH